MKKRLISIIILIAYSAVLIKVMVFKDVPTIRVGSLMLNFGGTDASHPANFIPFKTIVPYLLGHKGLIIAGINLIGNIALLVPIGFLVPLVYSKMTWKKSLILSVASGLIIEVMQVVLHVGIFDIDDVILNALGVIIGYGVYVILARWIRLKKYKTIIATASIVLVVILATLYVVYPKGEQYSPVDFNNGEQRDLCGGTGGNGEIVSLGNNAFTIKRKDGENQIITITNGASIRSSAGPISKSNLEIGDSVTLVGGTNPDGSFTADTVLVCGVSSLENQ